MPYPEAQNSGNLGGKWHFMNSRSSTCPPSNDDLLILKDIF